MKTIPAWPLSSGWRCGTSGRGEGSPPARRSAPLRPLCTYRTAGGWSTSPASPEEQTETQKLRQISAKRAGTKAPQNVWNEVTRQTAGPEPCEPPAGPRWPLKSQHSIATALLRKASTANLRDFQPLSDFWVFASSPHVCLEPRSTQKPEEAPANGYSYRGVCPGQIYRLVKHKCSFLTLSYSKNNKVSSYVITKNI